MAVTSGLRTPGLGGHRALRLLKEVSERNGAGTREGVARGGSPWRGQTGSRSEGAWGGLSHSQHAGLGLVGMQTPGQ